MVSSVTHLSINMMPALVPLGRGDAIFGGPLVQAFSGQSGMPGGRRRLDCSVPVA
jgi:hypothetical protein